MNRGFSLVELSIVLVILGLLTGGILAGQSLIRAAELRGVSTEFSNYITAMGTFKSKYLAVPGDMTNATAFWGAAHADPATCITTNSGTSATCNGDGNGYHTTSSTLVEGLRAWQHLANAGLVSGSYTGVTTTPPVAGQNLPTSRLTNAAWMFGSVVSAYGRSVASLEFAGTGTTQTFSTLAVISPEEGWNIDQKLDDGKASSGIVLGMGAYPASSTVGQCVDAAPSASSAEYILANTGKQCRLFFVWYGR